MKGIDRRFLVWICASVCAAAFFPGQSFAQDRPSDAAAKTGTPAQESQPPVRLSGDYFERGGKRFLPWA